MEDKSKTKYYDHRWDHIVSIVFIYDFLILKYTLMYRLYMQKYTNTHIMPSFMIISL